MRSDSLLYRMRGVIALTILAAFVLAFVLTACGNGEAQPPPTPDEADEVLVLSASSAEPALEQIADQLRNGEDSLDLQIDYGGTSTLVPQIESGRAFDVVLTASRDHMAGLVSEGHIEGDPLPVATNQLVLAVPQDNPGEIEDFEDFASRTDELTTAVCADQVPCGELAASMARELDVDLEADAEETAASEVLSKLTAGEVDAGLVYLTDALAAELNYAELPDFEGSTNQLWIGVSAESEDADAAERLFQHFAGESSRSAFDDAGFLAPPAESGDES